MIFNFHHEPLPKTHIRLIDLDPELKDGRSQLTVQSYIRNRPPQHVCLSYRWGPDPPSEPIYLNGQQFSVRAGRDHSVELSSPCAHGRDIQ